jgi:hypothetical protein
VRVPLEILNRSRGRFRTRGSRTAESGEVLGKRIGKRGVLLLKLDSVRVVRIPGPREPHLRDIELRELIGETVEPGNVVLMSVCRDNDGKSSGGDLGNVVDDAAERADVSLGMDATVDKNVTVAGGSASIDCRGE